MANDSIWFPAKKYGWGWGFPVAWQGWVVLVTYFALLAGGLVLLDPRTNASGCAAYAVFLSLTLIAICWRKGERPRWRWG